MKFVIIDTAQYHGDSEISPEYIDKLKDRYKLKTVKVKEYNKEVEYTIVTINNIYSLIELQKLVGKFIIIELENLYLPKKIEEIKEIEDIANSAIIIYDDYIE